MMGGFWAILGLLGAGILIDWVAVRLTFNTVNKLPVKAANFSAIITAINIFAYTLFNAILDIVDYNGL